MRLEYEVIFGRSFDRAEREIESLETEITLKESCWIFQVHTHTQEELLKSARFNKVYSITGKIGDDVLNWVRRGALPDAGKEEYRRRRDQVARRLRSVHRAIRAREVLFWEKWGSVFESVTNVILRNLPTLVRLAKALKGLPPTRLLTS